MGNDIVNPDLNQPQTSGPKRDQNRKYIKAEWKPAGSGGGAPKISGGHEVDKHGNPVATRGLNRAGQHYELTQTEVQTRRAASAAAEYSTTLVLDDGEFGFSLRSPSGNNYKVSTNTAKCDCPDYFKQEQTGYGIVKCKHIYIVQQALTDPAYPFGLPWSTRKFAQVVGIDIRTVEHLCQEGEIAAASIAGVWAIDPEFAQTYADAYLAKIIGG